MWGTWDMLASQEVLCSMELVGQFIDWLGS